jgi:hypothetical protein
MIFAGQILWATSITCVRIDLLLCYRRIFITRAFRIADTIVLIVTVLWWISAFLVSSTEALRHWRLMDYLGHDIILLMGSNNSERYKLPSLAYLIRYHEYGFGSGHPRIAIVIDQYSENES